jgi:peptidoglycan-associated lipoprotein
MARNIYSTRQNMKKDLLYPVAVALSIFLTSAGCKSERSDVKPGDTWPAPTSSQTPRGDTLSPGESPAGFSTGQPIPQTSHWVAAENSLDRKTLAACTIHFAFGSTVIPDNERSKLQSVNLALQSDPNLKLMIEGNCDERGSEKYNRFLGERRALAAREALATLGIDPMRVRTISFGKDKPAAHGHDEAARWQNRRVDFVLLHPYTGPAE